MAGRGGEGRGGICTLAHMAGFRNDRGGRRTDSQEEEKEEEEVVVEEEEKRWGEGREQQEGRGRGDKGDEWGEEEDGGADGVRRKNEEVEN